MVENKIDPPEEESVPFDDCLRILVNTPPQPKTAEKQAEPKRAEEEPEK